MTKNSPLVHLASTILPCFLMFLARSEVNITTDQSSLLALKSFITFDPENSLSNWSQNRTICSWFGVSCSSQHHRVTALNISNMGFIGTIAPHLGNLSFLVSLDISTNQFHGTLPDDLAHLRRLRYLNVNSNNFSGDIPPWISVLPDIQHLFLAYNRFSGSIPRALFSLSNLESLVLGFNLLTGSVPQEIGNLTKLQWVSFGTNRLTGTIPPSMFNVSSLQRAILTNNSLSGGLPMNLCSRLPQLEVLALSVNELVGKIPPGLEECKNLQILSLSYNKFSGNIPRELGNLTQLVNLYLGVNNLEGEIPKEIGNLPLSLLSMENSGVGGVLPSSIYNITGLQSINLNGNKLSGSLPADLCSTLPVLATLDFRRNQFTGHIPREIGNCSLLRDFFLSDNNFTGQVPAEIGGLLSIERIALNNNSFTGPIPTALFNNSIIRGIALLGNDFSGSLPSNLGIGLPNLEELYLGINNLSGTIPDSIANASKLARLGLGYNRFTGPFPHAFGNLKMLRYLSVNQNNLTSEPSSPELSFFTSLTNCRQLQELWIGYNPLNGVLPASIGNFSGSLSYVYLAYSRIKGSIPSEVANISNLGFLFLQGNDLTGSIPKSIGVLKELQAFNIYDNAIEGPIPSEICSLMNLGFLSMSYNELCCSVPACIGNISSLRNLYLSSNRLGSSVPMSIWRLNNLLELDLSFNTLSGSMPPEIGSLKVATYFDISSNGISGTIPSTIAGMQNMAELYLNVNRLEGPIPDSLGQMLALESLDLSHNYLSGAIPKSLEALSYLSNFNVSYNKLSGEVPSKGPFENFNYTSYMQNEGLCGSIKLRIPACIAGSPSKSSHRKLLMALLIPLAAGFTILAAVIVFLLVRSSKKGSSISTDRDPLNITTHGRISYHELRQATDGFSEQKLIGTGAYGSVYKAEIDGTHFAVKVFNLQLESAFKSFDVECEVLRNLRHRNLTKVISICSSPDFKALVLEYMPNGSLEKWLYSEDLDLDFMQKLDITINVASALEYLHNSYSVPVVHCDLKPSNVLLDEQMLAHVCDFGIAKLLGVEESNAQTQTLATVGYMAPEYGSEGIVSTSCDIYSFGIMMMETFTRKKPTDVMFSEILTIKDWISGSLLPDARTGTIDANLIMPEEDNYDGKVHCLSSILELALQCSSDSPEERLNIENVLTSLHKLRANLLKSTSKAKS